MSEHTAARQRYTVRLSNLLPHALVRMAWWQVLGYCPNAVEPGEWEDWHFTMERRRGR